MCILFQTNAKSEPIDPIQEKFYAFQESRIMDSTKHIINQALKSPIYELATWAKIEYLISNMKANFSLQMLDNTNLQLKELLSDNRLQEHPFLNAHLNYSIGVLNVLSNQQFMSLYYFNESEFLFESIDSNNKWIKNAMSKLYNMKANVYEHFDDEDLAVEYYKRVIDIQEIYEVGKQRLNHFESIIDILLKKKEFSAVVQY